MLFLVACLAFLSPAAATASALFLCCFCCIPLLLLLLLSLTTTPLPLHLTRENKPHPTFASLYLMLCCVTLVFPLMPVLLLLILFIKTAHPAAPFCSCCAFCLHLPCCCYCKSPTATAQAATMSLLRAHVRAKTSSLLPHFGLLLLLCTATTAAAAAVMLINRCSQYSSTYQHT
jgi:hypothetical protein